MTRLLTMLILLILLLSNILGVSAQNTALSILWHESEACTRLDALTDDYTDATITVRCVPESQWFDTIFIDFAAGIGADLVVMDTQFIGSAMRGQSVITLDDWLAQYDTMPFVPEVLDMHRADDGTLIAMPLQPDVRLLAYRTDILQQANSATPETWPELLTIAQAVQNSGIIESGYATHWRRQADDVAASFNHILWAYGANLWDAETYSVEAVLNTNSSLEALTLANSLWQTAPDGATAFAADDVIASICDGTTALVEIWSSDAARLTDSETCDQADTIQFVPVPAGEVAHVTGYNGVGVSISAYSPNQAAALDFLTWLQSEPIQAQWIAAGGFSARADSIQAAIINGEQPYLAAYAQSLPLVRDYWRIPEYQIMLNIYQQFINLAISGQMSPREALDTIATEQQAVLDETYNAQP